MKLTRQSTTVVLAVPLIGVGFAAGWTDELLDTRPLTGAFVSVTHHESRSDPGMAVPLASLLEAAPATAARPPAAAPVVHRSVRTQGTVAVRPSPPAVAWRNHLVSGDGTLDTSVGTYADCSGRSPLGRSEAAIDTCFSAPMYFLGHNLGVFSPLMHMAVGALIRYYDGGGEEHRWRVAFIHDGWSIGPGRPQPAGPDVVAQFQTCANGYGSVARVLDLVEA